MRNVEEKVQLGEAPRPWRGSTRAPWLVLAGVLLACGVGARAAGPSGHIVPVVRPLRGEFPAARVLPQEPRAQRERPRVEFSAAISDMTRLVSPDRLNNDVLTLTGHVTRRADSEEAREAANWIAAQLRACGADSVELQSWATYYAPNVVAVRRGSVSPERLIVVGGHYDSIARTPESTAAPGADDNASGTAGVLECARVLCRYRFASTLVFVAFGAEEFGLVGSNAFAHQARSRDDDIAAMLNLDMIGYLEPGDERDLDIIYNRESTWLRDTAARSCSLYVPELPVVDGQLPGGAGSDHISFWNYGYDAIFFFEDTEQYSPYIHTIDDTYFTSYNDTRLATLYTRSAVALLATLAEPIEVPVTVQDLRARYANARVELGWRLSNAALRRLDGVQVERADAAAGPFERRGGAPLVPEESMQFMENDVELGRTYWYRLMLLESEGGSEAVGPIELAITDVTARTTLRTPFESEAGAVQIRYALASRPAELSLGIFDVRGRLVHAFDEVRREPGEHLLSWDRSDASSARVARGVYFVRLDADREHATRKLVLAHD